MADLVDDANDREETRMEVIIKEARKKAQEIPRGEPGECDLCGEWSGRLVTGICAPCRDKYRIK